MPGVDMRTKTTIEITTVARDALREICAERHITYSEAIMMLSQSSKIILEKKTADLINLYCRARKIEENDAIVDLIKKEIKTVVTTQKVDDQGNIIETLEER